MAYTTIDDPSEYFQTALYTGNATQRNITNDGNSDLQPDWVWIKCRSAVESHMLYDSSRGVTKDLRTDGTNAENTNAQGLQAFNSDGFQIGTLQNVNFDTKTMVAWQWKANGGTTSSNSDGSITSTVQANTTAGFSIVTYTGNGTSGATIGHGLNSAPEWTIIKRRSDTEAWPVWHTAFGSAQSNVRLNGTDAVDTSSSAMFNNTFPTSSLITLGNGNFVNTNTETYVAYCFSEVKGYSKFGSYTGNGSSDGTFIYTGFKPAWFLAKRTNDSSHWTMLDTTRNPFNLAENYFHANETNAENNNNQKADFLSNGIKLRSSSRHNDSGSTFIYMAFAEHPFVSSKGVPVTAR